MRLPHPYCLRCYLPLERTGAAVETCPRCGHENLRVDQGLYWTQEPWLRRLEAVAKALVVLVVLALCGAILAGVTGEMHLGTGQGFVLGLPILLGAVLWNTASKITRRGGYFRAGLLWSVLLALAGVPLLCLGLVSLAQRGRGWASSDLAPLAIGGSLVGLAAALPLLGRAFLRWRERRVLAGARG